MFNSEALDVVIGIVLIYLLYSTIVTFVGEYLSTKLGLRARILRVAIERMLNDGYYYNGRKYHRLKTWWINCLLRIFLYQPDSFTISFAGRFYDYPSIKFLSRVEKQTGWFFSLKKPAYISADYFSDTIIDMLKGKSAGISDMDRIAYALHYNTQHIQPLTLRIFNNYFDASRGDLVLFKNGLMKWFNETMDRANGWYKRKLQFLLLILGFAIACFFNVDSIRIARILSKDKEARGQLVNIGIQLSNKEKSGTNKNEIQSKTVIDKGLSSVQKDISDANLILGSGWDFNKLTKNDKYSLSVSDGLPYINVLKFGRLFDTLTRENARIKVNINIDLNRISSIKCKQDSLSYESSIDKSRLLVAPGSKLLKARLLAHNKNLRSFGTALKVAVAENSSDSLFYSYNQKRLDTLGKLFLKTNFILTKYAFVGSGKSPTVTITGIRFYTFWEKFINFWHGVWVHLLGFLITALALSLGAPFWFSLLDKLLSIRSSGIKPDDKIGLVDPQPATGPPPPPPPPPVVGGVGSPAPTGDPDRDAMNAFAFQLKNEPGMVSLALLASPKALSVNVLADNVLAALSSKFGNKFVNGDYQIPILYNVSGPNNLSASQVADSIQNKTGALGRGTLGCYMEKTTDSRIFFISCWHVMKESTNLNPPIDPNQATIIDLGDNNNIIGQFIDGGLADTYDIGIAVNLDTSGTPSNAVPNSPTFAISRQHRAVTTADETLSTPVLIGGSGGKIKSANVFNANIAAWLPYPDGQTHTLHDLFSVSLPGSSTNNAPTGDGDSGSVVIDGNGAPLGMIIGYKDNLSYAMKFSNVFDPGKPYFGYTFLLFKTTSQS